MPHSELIWIILPAVVMTFVTALLVAKKKAHHQYIPVETRPIQCRRNRIG